MKNQNFSEIIKSVKASSKYKHVNEELIVSIAQTETSKRGSQKAVLKAVKNKLHQVGGAYQANSAFSDWSDYLLNSNPSSDDVRQLCKQWMRFHRSTQERLPILSDFYNTIFSHLPPINSILDIACGLNPLAVSWMNISSDTTYIACDIYQDMIDFLNVFFFITGTQGKAFCQDVLSSPPSEKVDLILLLKTIPCLEQIQKNAGKILLDNLDANFLVVSYPVQSLTGKEKGMLDFYTNQFQSLVSDKNWSIEKFVFESELLFLVFC
ncbi:MAG: hypothetical protein JXA19_01415 [Anaerolineales bacterium]|nr:hypothetical protein [Anaerolineales bacterium]